MAVLIILGAYVTYLSAKLLLIKRATNSQGNPIVLDENNMTFTAVQKYRGALTTVNYDAIDKVTITDISETTATAEEKTLEISMPSLTPKNMNLMRFTWQKILTSMPLSTRSNAEPSMPPLKEINR